MTTTNPAALIAECMESLPDFLDAGGLAGYAGKLLKRSINALTAERARAETAEEALKAIVAKAFTARVEEGWTSGTTSIIDIASTALTRIAALKDPHSNAD